MTTAAPQSDGLTPLHLVASRSELSDAAAKIVPLDEAAQAAMARRLLDAGADRRAAATVDLSEWGGEAKPLCPEHLVDSSRPGQALCQPLRFCPIHIGQISLI